LPKHTKTHHKSRVLTLHPRNSSREPAQTPLAAEYVPTPRGCFWLAFFASRRVREARFPFSCNVCGWRHRTPYCPRLHIHHPRPARSPRCGGIPCSFAKQTGGGFASHLRHNSELNPADGCLTAGLWTISRLFCCSEFGTWGSEVQTLSDARIACADGSKGGWGGRKPAPWHRVPLEDLRRDTDFPARAAGGGMLIAECCACSSCRGEGCMPCRDAHHSVATW